MNRRVLLGMAGWLAVAAAATTAGIAAITVLEDGITGQNVRPLDDDAVHRALSRSGTTPPRPTLTAAPTPSSTAGVTRSLAAGGGTVTARCEGGRVTVVAATPYQGFRTDGVEHGPAASVSLTFKSSDEEYAVTMTCDNGSPVARTAQDDGHHGRNRGGGRGRG
jgi:serine/threonine-protein kinase